MVTYRPYISFPLIKLSQYSTKPRLEHFDVLQELYHENFDPKIRQQNNKFNTRATVDFDYANDTTHVRSVTGISIKLAGGTIFYKIAFQTIVAFSSTETEFIAAYEASTVILYIRSILDGINIR